ncbi:hypothetical protein [Plantactinospora sp. ZYX-F-223]|uniref:hypothetical protein n=1 Tax=Plantactinospora sp. ZYX-F-223 TaxID=3144103 RepID=UPI0031FD2866
MADYDIRLTLKREKAESSVVSTAMSNRWMMHTMGIRNADVFINGWSTPQGVDVRYVEDPLTGIAFVTLRGARSHEVAELLRRRCELWDFTEALGTLRQLKPGNKSRDSRLTAAYAAAYTAPDEPVPAMVEMFGTLAADRDPGIRQAVIVATGYKPWPALVRLVEHLAKQDPIDHVRHNATVLLEGLRSQQN